MAPTDEPNARPEPPEAVIRVRGARVHNLRNLDVDLPRDRLVVLTGVSGSGKSSLAFDTLYAEGQRRYIEGLSSYARQFLDQMEPPDVDLIEGLPPTVAIGQASGAANPRSTVGTVTEIADALRLLFARAGLPHCPKCGAPIRRQAPEQMVATALALPRGSKVLLLAPLVRGRKGQHAEAFEAIRREGLLRARVDGEVVEIEPPPKLAKTKAHTIEAVVDRLMIREGIRPRLAESIDRALKLGDGTVFLSAQDEAGAWRDVVLSLRYACPRCGTGFEELEPRTFSFNSPYGACPTCEGLGVVAPASEPETAEAVREPAVCPDCAGVRLRPEARAVTVGGRTIGEVVGLTVDAARVYFAGLAFDPPLDRVGPPLVREIVGRLEFLDRVGLGYLTLGRGADTLSGGELQRVRLATQMGAGLVGVGYILDEPTAGLHPSDTDRLLDSLRALRDAGNSVIAVEHDEAVIRAADWVVDLGPGAGPDGGRLVAAGPPAALDDSGGSMTARYLRGELAIPIPARSRLETSPGWIEMIGATEHNLRGDPVRIPLGALTCVTGVSGSGKSTLVQDVLARTVRRHLAGLGSTSGASGQVAGLEAIDRLIEVDQAPIGRTPRSTPSTFTGVFDEIRKVFATTREAKVRGYKANRFSFNVKGGRCETCQGQGSRRVEMQFLPDLFVRCEACDGQRFNRPTLEVRYRGKSIGGVLEMRVDEAVAFFDAIPKVRRGLEALHDAGLGYVTLGQSSTTLSGGEAQRVKLAADLGRAPTGRALYLLDEPTTGLHFADVANLLHVLSRLADLGQTLVVIEHQLDVIRAADWVVDLGPGAGPDGGRVVAMGPPRVLAQAEAGATGRYLRPFFTP